MRERWAAAAVTVQSHALLASKFPGRLHFHFQDLKPARAATEITRDLAKQEMTQMRKRGSVLFSLSACSSQKWPHHLRQPWKVEVLNVILPVPSQCKPPPLPHPSHKLMASRVSIRRTCARQNLRTHKTSLWFAAAASNHRPIRGIFAVGGCFKRLNPSSQRGACAGHCRHPGDTL